MDLAYEAINKGGNTACIMNAANEIAVANFLQDKISFNAIPKYIEQTIAKVSWQANPLLEDYFACDRESRIVAQELMNKI